MLKRGDIVVVHDHDIKDSYVAELQEDFAPHRLVHPLVRILSVLCYPRQTAIMHEERLTENPPIPCDTITRLGYVCRWPLDGVPAPYADSVVKARREYVQEAAANGRQDILSVLAAHAEGRLGLLRRLPPTHPRSQGV